MELICGTELANEHLKAIESLWRYQDEEILEKEIRSCECGDHEAKYLFIDELGNKINLKNIIKLIEIPVYASVSAGCGRIPEREPIDYISLPEVSSDCIAIKVDGESMEPTLSPGDLIVLKKEMEVNIGDIGVFLNKTTGESFVKRLKNRNGNYILESDNSLFSDIEINTDEIYCCGKVINVVKSNLKNKKNQLQEIFDEIPSDKIELAKKLLKTLIP